MAVETEYDRPEPAEPVPADGRNGVAVEFDDGSVRAYAVVVRPPDGDWFHAERLVGDGDGLNEEEVEALNPDAVRRIRSDRVHFCADGAVHIGEGLLVDPERIAADCRR